MTPAIAARPSQEVVARAATIWGYMSLFFGDRREDAKLGVQILVDSHDGSDISTSVTIVGSRPNSNNGPFGKMELNNKG